MSVEHRMVHSGNRIEIQLNGQVVGLIQSLRASDDYGHEPATGVGDAHVQEYVPGMARHSLSVSTMVLFRGNLRDAGVTMENADEVLRGLVFDVCVYGKDPKATGLLRKYVKCTFVSGDLDIQKHAIVAASAQFMALDVTGRVI